MRIVALIMVVIHVVLFASISPMDSYDSDKLITNQIMTTVFYVSNP